MPVRILCPCGADVTAAVSAVDKKTRTVHWFEQHGPQCAACRLRHEQGAAAESPAAARRNGRDRR